MATDVLMMMMTSLGRLSVDRCATFIVGYIDGCGVDVLTHELFVNWMAPVEMHRLFTDTYELLLLLLYPAAVAAWHDAAERVTSKPHPN